MKHEVLYHRDAPWTVGETKAEREARIRAGTRAASEDCYRDTHPGRVISIRPVESDLPSLRNMADKDRPVVVLDIDDDERQGAASKTMKVMDGRLVPVTFDDRFGAVATKLREQRADPETWERDEATRVKTEEAENEKRRADYDRALEEYKALVETFPIELHEWSMEDAGIPPAMPERPKAATFIDVAPSRFDREVSALSRSLAPTVTETGTGLYSVKVTPTKLDRTQSGAPAGQVITFTTGGLGVAAAFAGGYITNVTRSQTRAIVSHIDDAATLEGDVTTWLDTDDLDIYDAWSTIQAALDQLFTDQGATNFAAIQYIRVFAGTYDENVVPNTTLNPIYAFALIIEGDPADSRANVILQPSGGTDAIYINNDGVTIVRHMTVDGTNVSGETIQSDASPELAIVHDCVAIGGSAGTVVSLRVNGICTDSVITANGGAGFVSGVGGRGYLAGCKITQEGARGTSIGCNARVTVDACRISGFSKGVNIGTEYQPVQIRNCTIYDCTYGIGNTRPSPSRAEITNTIFHTLTNVFNFEASYGWPQETADGVGQDIQLRNNVYYNYTDFAENTVEAKIYTEFAAFNRVDASGDIFTDPLLTDPASGDFSLQTGSPAINAGHGSGVVTGINGVAFDPYHPDIGAWSSGVCVAPPAPSVSATDLGNQADFKVDVVPDDEADVSTIFYQLVPNGLVQAWPTPITGTGSATITGQVGTYAVWATAVRCGITSDSSTIDFVTIQAANEVTNIRTALREWVKGVVGNPAVDWRESNAPQSIRPYVTIKMGPFLTVGSDYHGGNDDSGVETIVGAREFVFSIQVHGKQSDEDEGEVVSMLNRIRSSLEKQSVQDTLSAATLAFVAVEGSSDLAGIGGTRWEARAFVDIRFRTTYSDTDDVGYIGTVEKPVGTFE